MGPSRRTTRYVLIETANPAMRINEAFPAYESLRHPRCQQIRRRYRLDGVVRGETDEFRRILLLRHWIRQHIRISNARPTPAREGDVFSILDAALDGGGFHCAHFSLVQQAVYNSFGYVTRRLGAGPGLNEPGKWGHHGVNEVWVNPLCKWVLVDAKYDFHFEKCGLPLSALETRDELLADGGQSVRLAVGPDRRLQRKPSKSIGTYRWISWEVSPSFTDFPNHGSSGLIVYEDDFFRNNVWYRDGAPHWAYAADFLIPVRHRSWIEWTPNVIASHVDIAGDRARVAITSCTPNLLTYQVRRQVCRGDGTWRGCGDRLDLPLGKSGIGLSLRSMNLAGATGPEHMIEIRPVP